MASPATRVTFRVVVAVLVIMVLFYVGRPLYWKISATVQEIRENKRTVKQGAFFNPYVYIFRYTYIEKIEIGSVKQCVFCFVFVFGTGISQIVYEAQKSVGWFHDESDSGFHEDRKVVNRRLLF